MRVIVSLQVVLFVAAFATSSHAQTLRSIHPVVEIEEEVYRYTPADNGAGPMWCRGNTCIVRQGNRVFASGLETIPGAKPLNNCLALLYMRDGRSWSQIYRGLGRTREPCPLALFSDQRILLSANPTLTPADTYNGPSEPRILVFSAVDPRQSPQTLVPQWEGSPRFTEHSYRSFAADGPNNELILFQNIGYGHAEWTFRNRHEQWSAQGRLEWPWGAEYDKPQPIRICYPTVALKDRAVYFCGVSDIVEPYQKWRDYKHQITGRKWDYDFRRLFYTWSSDITKGTFHNWIEISSRDQTAGWITPQDLHVLPNGDVMILWTERALDERLRKTFFPKEKQRHSLELAVFRQGSVQKRLTIIEGGEDLGPLRPGGARFHITEEERVFLFYYMSGSDNTASGNFLREVCLEGRLGQAVPIRLNKPLSSFFTNTIRAGNQPSAILDLFGNSGNSMRYVRIKIRSRE